MTQAFNLKRPSLLALFLPPCLSRLSVRHSCLRSDGLNSHSEGAIQSQTNRQACLPVRMDQKRQLGFPSSAQSAAVNPVHFVNPVILSKQPFYKFCPFCLKRIVLRVLAAQREVIIGSCSGAFHAFSKGIPSKNLVPLSKSKINGLALG